VANHPASSRQNIHTLGSIKNQIGVLLSNEKDILAIWRKYSKDLLNPVTIIPSDTKELHLVKENTITAMELFVAGKTLKDEKAAECDEIRS